MKDKARAAMLAEIEATSAMVFCGECEGAGVFERIVGEDRSGRGGISPVTREELCYECGGDGLEGCAWCGMTPAYQIHPSHDVECIQCIERLHYDTLTEEVE
jgi:hypothetical protein